MNDISILNFKCIGWPDPRSKSQYKHIKTIKIGIAENKG